MIDDRLLQAAVETALAGIVTSHLSVRVEHGFVYLAGNVASEADRQRAAQFVTAVEGVQAVQNELVFDPDMADATGTTDEVATERLEEIEIGETPELDLNRPAGTTDPLRPEVQPDEPYFPPTDPVIEPLGRLEGGYRVLGGFSEGALDRPFSSEAVPERLENSDEQIAESVSLALKEDAATTDLDIHVHVRNGVVVLHGRVHYLEDVEAAEGVAGNVPGVREVSEQLQLE